MSTEQEPEDIPVEMTEDEFLDRLELGGQYFKEMIKHGFEGLNELQDIYSEYTNGKDRNKLMKFSILGDKITIAFVIKPPAGFQHI